MTTRFLTATLAAAFLATAAGAATPKRAGTLVVARPPLNCLNPFEPACNVPTSDPVFTQVLEGAFEVGSDLVFRPNLVAKVTIGRNPFTLTYHIRPNARWSDGVPVSAADFRFTYRTFSRQGLLREDYARIRSVRSLGPKTFRLELREPFSDWRELFATVLPAHALAGEDLTAAGLWRDRVDNPKTGRPIGSGPFLVSRLEPGRQVTLVRNPNYWGGHPAYLDRFVFRFGGFDQSDPLGSLRRNAVHFTYGRPGSNNLTLDAAEAAEAARIPGWRAAAWPSLPKEVLVLRAGRGGHPALRNKLVRRALAHGIDRVAVARRVNSDLGRRALPLDSTVLLAGEPFHRPNWRGFRYDPPRARRLLEQAGCRRGVDGIYECAGERLRLRFFTSAGQPWREQALQLARTHLLQVGVEVQLTYAPPASLFFTILPRGDFDAALISWTRVGGGATPETRCGHEQNWSGYCSRLTMRDAQQTDRIVDPKLRAGVLNDVDEKLVRDVPLLPLFQRVVRVAHKDAVRGFVPGGTHFQFFENSEDWWLAP